MKKITIIFVAFMFFSLVLEAQSPATYFPSQWSKSSTVLKSPNGQYRLIYQSDGNLVIYQEGNIAIWNTVTQGKASNSLKFQTDGNFVLYGNSGAIWNAGCQSKGGNYITLQDDGNLVIYTAQNIPVWNSKGF
jgi:hypothetical protein